MNKVFSHHFVGGTTFIVTMSLIIFLQSKKSQKKTEKVIVSDIFIYPIKSCKGIRVDAAKISKTGLAFDRLFMVVDNKNNFLSQRTQPKLCLVETAINYESSTLTISASTMPTVLSVPLQQATTVQNNFEVTVWGDVCIASEALGNIGNEWFSIFLDLKDVRLVRMCDNFIRKTDPEYAVDGQASFADGFPFLLCSKSSLDELNKKLLRPIPMENFRPNIVVDCSIPFAEDNWNDIVFRANDDSIVPMTVVKPCSRCQIPSLNQQTGEFDADNEPTRSMKLFRTGKYIGYNKEKWKGQVFSLLLSLFLRYQ